MNYREIIDKVAEELNLPKMLVYKTYKYYWLTIKDHLESLPLKDKKVLTENEFNKLQTSVSVNCIGKIACTYEKYSRTRKKFERIKRYKESKGEV